MARGSDWSKLGREKVESSGLTVEVAEKLGMYEVPSAKQINQHFDARAALVIPYKDLKGKPLKPHKAHEEFYRLRYLQKDTSWTGVAEKEIRYVQPYGTPPCAYFPNVDNIDWTAIKEDPDFDVMFTEGELKAAAGCVNRYPTIGLGGVYSFRDAKNGWFFLRELDDFVWAKRTVYIVYDSDFTTNSMVCAAINSLMEELQERGAYVKVVLLPPDGDKKVGLDDYFLNHTTSDFDDLLTAAEPISMTRQLWAINEEIVYVSDPGMVVTMDTSQKMNPGAFKEHSRWSTLSAVSRKMASDGSIKLEKVAAAAAWLKWPLRRELKKITYAPGQPKITDDDNFNSWHGWGCEPRKGNVKPWTDLVDFLFKDMEKEDKEWFLDWCAYPLQNPGHKMFSAVIIHSVAQGTGKSLLGYTLGAIYGKNFKEIKDANLEGEYTAWAEGRQFILGDEITGNDNRRHAATLKRLISQRTVEINIKHLPQYDIPDCINYLFTAQHVDSFFLEDSDRRFFVVEVKGQPRDEAFYLGYDQWLWRENGAAHLFQWLLDRKISKNFNPNAAARRTAAKERMIHAGKGELAAWVNDLKAYPDDILVFGQLRYTRDLFTAKELLNMYVSANGDTKTTSMGLGRVLAMAGFQQVLAGQPIRGADGKMARYFAIRNQEQWVACKSRKQIEQNISLQPINRKK